MKYLVCQNIDTSEDVLAEFETLDAADAWMRNQYDEETREECGIDIVIVE